MGVKENILKMIKESKLSLKDGLNMISDLNKYYTTTWTQKEIQNNVPVLIDKNILVITDHEKDIFRPFQESNNVSFEKDPDRLNDHRNADIIIVFIKDPDIDTAKNILNLYKNIVSNHVEVSDFYYLYEKNDDISPVNEAMGALLGSFSLENSNINFHTLQFNERKNIAECVKNEFGNKNDLQVRYDVNGKRLVRDIVPAADASNDIPFRDDKTYVISGGAGGIGRIILKELTRRYRSNYILLGRSEKNNEILNIEKEFSVNGSKVEYYSCDITDTNEMKSVSEEIKRKYGNVNGIIHLAGVLRDGMAALKSQNDFLEVVNPKILGAENLYDYCGSDELDFITFCSSVSSLTGNVGQCDYSFANAYLDALTIKINQRLKKQIANTVGFPLWKNGGMKMNVSSSSNNGVSDQEGFEFFLSGYLFNEKVIYYIDENLHNMIKSSVEENSAESIVVKETNDDNLRDLTEKYLIKVISNEMKISESKLNIDTNLNEVGLDSIMVMEITKSIEKNIGSISKTLFFEYTDIISLAKALIKSKRDKLEIMFSDKLVKAQKNPIVNIEHKKEATIQPPVVKKNKRNTGTNDIAIIGLAGRYPMSNDMDELWENLSVGRDCIVEIPKDRWDHKKYFDPDKEKRGKTYSRWGGFIDDYDKFDPLFFNISPREADYLDPQERVFLETAWETIEDSGYTISELGKYNVGVFVGVMYGHYQLYNVEESLNGELPVQSSSYSSIANRVSYVLNLHGASVAIDTMCSSSLTAIHVACQSIRDGESDMAIVGGVNISSHPLKYIMLSQQKFLSTDGRCRSFGEGGDGYVPGEGSGAIMLKSLEQAEKDGDRIYAVIKGTGLNHGGKTRGFSVPNPVAQSGVIRSTLERYDIDARSINYVETHGTGTALGDPIEISGLMNAFGNTSKSCAIGSIKSNIGHTESASGVSAVSKVILQMKHKQLVPSIHSEKLNPNIDFNSIPFYVQRKLEDWKPVEVVESGKKVAYPRRAGISSFGAGGSNAFIIMEEYEDNRKYDQVPDEVLFVLSAKSEERLKVYAAKMKRFIDKKSSKKAANSNLLFNLLENEIRSIVSNSIQIPKEQIDTDVDFESMGIDYVTLQQMENTVFDYLRINERENIVGINNIKELVYSIIEKYENEMYAFFDSAIEEKEINELPELFEMTYMLQTGREQYANRLAIIASNYEELKEKLSDYLEDKDTAGIYKTNPNNSNDIISMLMNGAAGEAFIKNLFNNHELDKLAIMWCSGYSIDWKNYYGGMRIRKCSLPTYPFKKERHWLKLPDKSINTGNKVFPMLDDFVFDKEFKGITLKKEFSDTDAIVSDHIVNGHMVLPGVGYIEMVYEALDKVGKAGKFDIESIYWLIPISVDSGSVTVYVNLNFDETERIFEIFTLENNSKILHCKGKLDVKDISADKPVFKENIGNYQEVSGDSLYSVFGKKGITYNGIYQGIMNIKYADNEAISSIQVDTDADNYNIFPGVADSALQSIVTVMKNAPEKATLPYYIGRVRLYRKTDNNSKVYIKNNNSKINILIANEKNEVCVAFEDIVLRELTNKSENILYYPLWKENNNYEIKAFNSSKAVIIYNEKFGSLADKLEKNLKKINVIRVNISEDEAVEERIQDVISENSDIDEIFFLNGINEEIVGSGDETEFFASQKNSITLFYRSVKKLFDSDYSNKTLRLYVITNNTVAIKDYNRVNPYASVLHGFALSLDKEMPKWFMKCIDIDLFYDNDDNAVTQIINERSIETSSLIVYRENVRYLREIHPINIQGSNRSSFVKNGVYMIFGGSGGIGGALAIYLSKTQNANIVLIGRRPSNEAIEDRIEMIKKNGGDAIYVQADLGKYEDIINAINVTKKKYGNINGVIHSALVLQDKSVRFMSEDILDSTLESKVTGSFLLNKAFKNENIDFMLYFSSANSLISAAGQSNYSAACTFEDAYAEYQNLTNTYDVKHINWGYWGTIGVVSSQEYNKNLSKNGIQSIEPEEGMRAIEQLLANNISVLVPYKANRQMLNKLGIHLDQVIEMNSNTEIDSLQVIDDDLTNDQRERIHQRTNTFLKFEGVGGLLLLNRFQRMGYFKTASESYTIEQMKKDLGILSRYDRMFMALLSMLQRYKYVKIEKGVVKVLPIVEKKKTINLVENLYSDIEKLVTEYPEIKPYINLIKVCVEAYPDVLSGKVSHMSVMFPNGSKELVENIYTGNFLTDLFNIKMAELVRDYVRDVLSKDSNYNVRILEVGAGTGGTSGFIMKEISKYANNVTYTYTDISKSFVEFGRRKFGKEHPFVEFKVLNVEEDTARKKNEFGEYDIVLATNVLHATKAIDNTLLQIKKLMKNGAWIIVNEVTAIQDYATLTFGLTDGWWAYEDEYNRLPLSPLLDTFRWKKVMRNNGFINFSSYGTNGKDDNRSEQSLLIAQNDGIVYSEKIDNNDFDESKHIIELPVPSVKNETNIKKKALSINNVQEHLIKIFSNILNINENDIDINTNVADYGVDSLVSMEINKEIEKNYSEIPVTFIFEHPTISEMASILNENYSNEEISDDDTSLVEEPLSEDKLSAVKNDIIDIISKVLNINKDEISENAPLEEYGIDSLVTMELIDNISKIYPDVNVQMFLENANISGIAQQIIEASVSEQNPEAEEPDNISMKFVNSYSELDNEDFYMFWKNLGTSVDLDKYISGMPELKKLSKLRASKLGQIIVRSKNYDIEVLIGGTGKTMVFIPGFGVTGVQWRKQIEFFMKKCRVIVLHLPGVGLSAFKNDMSVSLENIASSFMQVLEQLGIKDEINVIGSSFGTMVAQEMAYIYKNKINSLTAISGFTSVDKKLKDVSVGDAVNNDIKDLDEDDKKMIRLSNYNNPSFAQYLAYIQQGQVYSTEDILDDINVKTLVINGEKDTVVDQSKFNNMALKIKDSKLFTIKNAGHILNWTNADEVNDLIQDFVDIDN